MKLSISFYHLQIVCFSILILYLKKYLWIYGTEEKEGKQIQLEKQRYIYHCWSDEIEKGTIVNPTYKKGEQSL